MRIRLLVVDGYVPVIQIQALYLDLAGLRQCALPRRIRIRRQGGGAYLSVRPLHHPFKVDEADMLGVGLAGPGFPVSATRSVPLQSQRLQWRLI